MSFLENSADIYGDDPVVTVCPNMTSSTAHELVCLTFFNGIDSPFLHALTVCYNERREAENSFVYLRNLATNNGNINTLEVFNCIKAILLTFQKSTFINT